LTDDAAIDASDRSVIGVTGCGVDRFMTSMLRIVADQEAGRLVHEVPTEEAR